MANQDQLRILNQGVESWNRWRKERRWIVPYLNGADLHEVNLRGANLHGADLSEADLHGANLCKVNLHGADLRGANLRGAKLIWADLSGADLSKADLEGAGLSMTYLLGANLSETRMPADFNPGKLFNPRKPGGKGWSKTRAADHLATNFAEIVSHDPATGDLSNPPEKQAEALLAQLETIPQAESVQVIGITEPVKFSDTNKAPSLVVEAIPESVTLSSFQDEYLEGSPKERRSKSYERDPRMHSAAIAIHGTKCVVCGFDFAATYGERGAGYIEVHHLRPISSLQGATKINIKTDLTVLCSNCHSMIHRNRDNALTPDELRAMIQRSRFDNSSKQVKEPQLTLKLG